MYGGKSNYKRYRFIFEYFDACFGEGKNTLEGKKTFFEAIFLYFGNINRFSVNFLVGSLLEKKAAKILPEINSVGSTMDFNPHLPREYS